MGGVKKHSLVMDPNVGTGSILVSAAAQGAHTFGFDIDIRVVKFGMFLFLFIDHLVFRSQQIIQYTHYNNKYILS